MAQVTITKANLRTKVNALLNNDWTGTTTSAGNADKKDLIDSELTHYNDDYFNGWWVMVASQVRRVSDFASATGTVDWITATTAQVGSGVSYFLSQYNIDVIDNCMNQALAMSFPRYYSRIEDETSLDGTGSGDTEYDVPATFKEFPEQILYKVITNTTDISYVEVTDYKMVKSAGSFKFYADIPTGKDIRLVGKTYLTQLTSSESSTTELDDTQANMVALLAASIFCRLQSATVNSKDAGRWDSLAQRYEDLYNEHADKTAEPRLTETELDFSWITGVESESFPRTARGSLTHQL